MHTQKQLIFDTQLSWFKQTIKYTHTNEAANKHYVEWKLQNSKWLHVAIILLILKRLVTLQKTNIYIFWYLWVSNFVYMKDRYTRYIVSRN